jgi:hypothetical protein
MRLRTPTATLTCSPDIRPYVSAAITDHLFPSPDRRLDLGAAVVACPYGPGRRVVSRPGRVTQSGLEVRAVFAKIMDKPGKLGESFCSETSSPACSAGSYFIQVSDKRLQFFFGTTNYTMGIVCHFALQTSLTANDFVRSDYLPCTESKVAAASTTPHPYIRVGGRLSHHINVVPLDEIGPNLSTAALEVPLREVIPDRPRPLPPAIMRAISSRSRRW